VTQQANLSTCLSCELQGGRSILPQDYAPAGGSLTQRPKIISLSPVQSNLLSKQANCILRNA